MLRKPKKPQEVLNLPETMATKARPIAGVKSSGEATLGIDGGIVGRFAATKASETPINAGETAHHWQEKRRVIWALSRTAAGLLYPAGTPSSEIKGVEGLS